MILRNWKLFLMVKQEKIKLILTRILGKRILVELCFHYSMTHWF